jgi:hypothetical protein
LVGEISVAWFIEFPLTISPAILLVFALGLLLSFAAAITLGSTSLYLSLRLARALFQNGWDAHGILPTCSRWFFEDVRPLILLANTTNTSSTLEWSGRFHRNVAAPDMSNVARKPDGSQDGPATMAKLQEDHPETFARKFGDAEDVKNEEAPTTLERKLPEINTQWYQHRFSSFRLDRTRHNSSSTVVTKEDGSQDGPATAAMYGQSSVGVDTAVSE